MKFTPFALLTGFLAYVNQAQASDAPAPFGGAGISQDGAVFLGPFYNHRAATAESFLASRANQTLPMQFSAPTEQVWNSTTNSQQTITIYSCSSTSCGLSVGYSDVNPGATYVPIGFGMADANGNVDFTPTASVTQLNGRAGISFGGAAQIASYFLSNQDKAVSQISALVAQYGVNKIDIDLENLADIPPSQMTNFLTSLHIALPDVTISVAPECPGVYPDGGMYVPGSVYNYWVEILNSCTFLEVFIQTYNNWCNAQTTPAGMIKQLNADWINPSSLNGYNGYNAKQIVVGYCASPSDPTACSYGYISGEDLRPIVRTTNEDYDCQVGAGLWASNSDKSNDYEISTAIIETFAECVVQEPSEAPTSVPSAPTVLPTVVPTKLPTEIPTQSPTPSPTESPSVIPSELPTVKPTTPTESPTFEPTAPTGQPSSSPSCRPNASAPAAGLSSTEYGEIAAGLMVMIAIGAYLAQKAYLNYQNYGTLFGKRTHERLLDQDNDEEKGKEKGYCCWKR